MKFLFSAILTLAFILTSMQSALSQNLPGGVELSIIKTDSTMTYKLKEVERHFLRFIKQRSVDCKIEDSVAPKSLRDFYHLMEGEKLSLDPKKMVTSDQKIDCSMDTTLKKSQQLAQCFFYDETFQNYLKVLLMDSQKLIEHVGEMEGDKVKAIEIKNYFQSIRIEG
jgi:hypothetical protein